MRPAFSSNREAAGFAGLLLVLLLLPILAGKHFLPPRSEIYSGITWRYGPFNYIRQQIFEDTNDIDIAFVGSSRLWAGIDTPQVEAALSKKLGRPAVVRTFGWAWPGFDADYFIAQDLLEHRKVRMIVFQDEYWVAPHVASIYWFGYGDNRETLAGFPARVQATYYFAALLGMPRNLLSLVRPNVTPVIAELDAEHWKHYFHSQNSRDLGGWMAMEGWALATQSFRPYVPDGTATPADVRVYSEQTKDAFQFIGPATPSEEQAFSQRLSRDMEIQPPYAPSGAGWQTGLARQFADLARAHGTALVYLHLTPVFPTDTTDLPVIREREYWPDLLGTNVAMLGIPPARLFAGLDQTEVARLFFANDHYHFNKNGAQFFTSLLTPTLLQLYETHANP